MPILSLMLSRAWSSPTLRWARWRPACGWPRRAVRSISTAFRPISFSFPPVRSWCRHWSAAICSAAARRATRSSMPSWTARRSSRSAEPPTGLITGSSFSRISTASRISRGKLSASRGSARSPTTWRASCFGKTVWKAAWTCARWAERWRLPRHFRTGRSPAPWRESCAGLL